MLLAIWREFEADRLAHAYLFTGESGVGKKTFARLLAKALLCQGEGEKPCNTCRSCKRFDAKTHGNVYYPVPPPKKNSIGVEELRGILDELSRAGLEEGRRVIVINEAERLTPASQNCLLKTLEEAPEGIYFLVVTDTERAILPTIRSRCRVIRFPGWSQQRIYKTLTENGIPGPRAQELTALCEGSLGKALKMQQDESYWAMREMVKQSFLRIRKAADIPAASQLLKDKKDEAETLLSILEQEVRRLICAKERDMADAAAYFPEHWLKADILSLCRVQDGIMRCKQYKSSNVGWAANAEALMLTIAEEARKWQL